MHKPKGKLSGEELKQFLTNASEKSMTDIRKHFSLYEPVSLYHHWSLLIRSIDEFLNMHREIKNHRTLRDFISLSFASYNKNEQNRFSKVMIGVQSQFGKQTAVRLSTFLQMNSLLTFDYETSGSSLGLIFNGRDVESLLLYYQSKRKYYVTLLDLIPTWAKGSLQIEYTEILSHFHQKVESCLQTAASLYYAAVLNEIYSDFSIDFSGELPVNSRNYYNLEGFFLEAQIMSMADVMIYRRSDVQILELPNKGSSKVFSFLEVENNIRLISATYQRYGIDALAEYIELSFLVGKLKEFCTDDFNICVPKERFDQEVGIYIRKLRLFADSDNYVDASNFISLFQLVGNVYYTSVVLLNRYVTNRIQLPLDKNKTFQIHSGFVFEKKIKEILKNCGFKVLNITRIKRQEFDVITIKGGRIYNFQCKNNLIDICRVQNNSKMTVRWNSKLVAYYKKAYRKELDRQDLVTEELGIDDIQHFVVSRYPVITDIDYIINYNKLEEVVGGWRV